MFCVGAAKAGTTWLHEYLSSHPDCGFRTLKELHYFDAIETGRWGGQVKRFDGEIRRLKARQDSLRGWRARRNAQRVADYAEWLDIVKGRRRDDARYLAFLRARGGRLVGDITPSYALLSAETLADMAALTPDVRFVYLLRDPVARLWSHVRMNAEREGGPLPVEERAQALLERVLADPGSDEAQLVLARSDYAGALLRLSSVVAPSKLFVCFMEDLIAPEGVNALCDFLGIQRHPGEYERRVHENKPVAMDPRCRGAAAALLQDQYEFVARIFPALPAAWQRSLGAMAA